MIKMSTSQETCTQYCAWRKLVLLLKIQHSTQLPMQNAIAAILEEATLLKEVSIVILNYGELRSIGSA